MIGQVKIINTEIISEDFHQLKKITYEYVKEDGTRDSKSQEVYDSGKAATVLLYNKEQKKVILTRQFRLPSFINGNSTGMLIESCAGLLEDESPEDCVKRESEEETGYKITEVQKIFEVYMSAGSVTELLYFFIAEYTPAMKVKEGGGLEEEQEDVDVLEIPIQQAMEMIDKGEIKDGKTIILLQYVKLHHFL